MTTRTTRTGLMWVARDWLTEDRTAPEADYFLVFEKPIRGSTHWDLPGPLDEFICLCPRAWHRLGLPRLKPGEGPVQMRVRMERVSR